MTISIEKKIYEACINYLITQESIAPSTKIYEIFQKSTCDRENSLNERYKQAIIEYRKKNYPKATSSKRAFFSLGHEEKRMQNDWLQHELKQTFGYSRPVTFSLTKTPMFYLDPDQIEFSQRWIEMCLIDTKDRDERKRWKVALMALFNKDLNEKKEPILHQKIALLESAAFENENLSSCKARVVSLIIKTLREYAAPLFNPILESPPSRESLETMESSLKQALSERVFCELFLTCAEGLQERPNDTVTIASLADYLVSYELEQIKQIFESRIKPHDSYNLTDLKNSFLKVLEESLKKGWIQKAGLQEKIEKLGREIISKFNVGGLAGFVSQEEYCGLISEKTSHFDLPSKKSIARLKKIKTLFQLQALLLDKPTVDNPTPRKLSKSSSTNTIKKFRSKSNSRRSSADTESALESIRKRLESIEITPLQSEQAQQAIEAFLGCLEESTNKAL
jgi:hypothetical protein